MPLSKHRLRDLGLEALFGLAVVAAIVLYAEFGPSHWIPSIRWWGFMGETVVLFGYVGRGMRPYWRNGRFWAGFLGFLSAHLVVYTVVLLRVQQFSLLWFVFIGYLEWVALAYLLDVLLRDQARTNPGRCHKAS
jgi:hypothetical protein